LAPQVKNLDAELVLDVVSKKMFDNFSMWQLQLKKMSLSRDKGLKVIDRLFQDTDNVLSELKKLVDNCLTDTKLCDDPCPSINMGEYLQVTKRKKNVSVTKGPSLDRTL
jgi:hypothetical protein